MIIEMGVYILCHLLYYKYKSNQLIEESLTVMNEIGIQIEKTKYNGKKSIFFLDNARINNFIIYERLTPYDAYYVLAIIPKCSFQKQEKDQQNIQNSSNLILLFHDFHLSLNTMLKIFYQARALLQLDQYQ
eukprot:TRINITY_DN45262_c0_g1_i1.p3 TRINITY_DN45262_c0_g1~~TRINITY_DN45262_c0_g1_i1.p3  ORF type:complete len:131 (-),score=19.05 TRINITY_DN45262_c0_g1_i1:83-475(-)